jgi:hypothetical protein
MMSDDVPCCGAACVFLQVVASLDLRGCDAAILLGRVNNEFAHQKQVRSLGMTKREGGAGELVTVCVYVHAPCMQAVQVA